MKTINYYLALPLIFLANLGSAQNYDVNYYTDTYESLTNYDTVDESDPEVDGLGSELYGEIPIGFDFEIEGETFDSLKVSESGYIKFISFNTDIAYISIFDCDLEDFNNSPSNSPIVYSTTGTPGNRIFKCEYIKKGFVNDSEKNDYVNFQVWLYENCNEFEARIGDMAIEASETDLFYGGNPAPIIGYGNYELSQYYGISGNYNSPQLDWSSTTLSSVPPNGTVYNFTNCTAGIKESTSESFSVSPNPTSGKILINYGNLTNIESIEVMNSQGQVVRSMDQLEFSHLEIDLSDLDNGLYMINVYTGSDRLTKKIVKQ
ncbi:MAG: T9SS type A sorting domain-containing protein [Brumimicrobium sp.]